MHSKARKYEIFTDGSKGTAGVGCAALSKDARIQKSLSDDTSVYTAELTAIKYALKIVEEQFNKTTKNM